MNIPSIYDAYVNLQKDREEYILILTELLDKLDLQFNEFLKDILPDRPLLFSTEKDMYLNNTHDFFRTLAENDDFFPSLFTLRIYLGNDESHNLELPVQLRLEGQTSLLVRAETGEVGFNAFFSDKQALLDLYGLFFQSLYNPMARISHT